MSPAARTTDPLAAYAAKVNAYAEFALADQRLPHALAGLRKAADEVQRLADQHAAKIDELTREAATLGVTGPGAHHVRIGPAWISARHVIRKIRVAEILHAVVSGDMDHARRAALTVTNSQGGPVR